MASKIKGITIELNANTTKLDKALKDVNKAAKATQENLKAVDKALKFDPTNTELLTQKQKLLADAVNDAAKKVELLKQKQQEMAASGDTTSQEYDKLTRQIMAAEGQLDKAREAADKFNVTTEKMKGYLDKASTALGTAAEKTKKYSAAAAGVVGALTGMAIKAGQTADEINTLSKTTGISTDTLQEMQYAADLVDVEVSTITGSLKKLTSQMNAAKKGTGTAADAFAKLGVQTTKVDGSLRDNEDVFYDVLAALSKVEDQTERDALAMEIFGKSATDLNPIIEDGGQALKDLGKEAKAAGLIMSKDALNGANKFNDALDRMKATAQGTLNTVGAELAEALTPVVEKLGEWVAGILEWVRSLGADRLLSILKIAAIVAAVSPVLTLLSKIASGLQIIFTHPLIAGAAAIAALIAGIAIAIGQTKDETNEYLETNKALDANLKATTEALNGYKAAVDDATSASKTQTTKINGVYDSYTKLWERLKKITDEQGNVIKGYEEEAKAITDQLEEALGIHINLVKGQVKNYNLLKTSMDKVIEAKRAEAILNANEAAYAAALTQRENLTNAVTSAEKNYNDVTTQLHRNIVDLNELEWKRKSIEEEMKRVAEDETLTVGEKTDKYKALEGALNEVERTQSKLVESNTVLKRQQAEAKAVLEEANAVWEQNESLLNNYEDLTVAVTTGTYNVNTAIGNLANGVKNLDTLLQPLEGNMEDIGKNAAKGLARGIRSSITDAEAAARDLGNRVQRGTEEALLISSPSKVMAKDGKYTVEGFALGITKNLAMVDKATAAMTAAVMGDAGAASTSEGAQVMAAGGGRQPIIVNMTQPIYLGGKTVGNAVTESVIENITAQQGLQAAFVGV